MVVELLGWGQEVWVEDALQCNPCLHLRMCEEGERVDHVWSVVLKTVGAQPLSSQRLQGKSGTHNRWGLMQKAVGVQPHKEKVGMSPQETGQVPGPRTQGPLKAQNSHTTSKFNTGKEVPGG